jgi:V8-like Glu-specific endopeptidase
MLRNFVRLVAFLLPAPAWAIVVSGTNAGSASVAYGQIVDGVNLSGVVTVTSSIGGCTGTLLSDGFTILTAGHCVTTAYGAALASNIAVGFLGPAGSVSVAVSSVTVNPGYTGDSTVGGDLAVIHLAAPPPSFAVGYALYTGSTPSGPEVIAGYGITGTGATGANGSYGSLNAGENVYVTTGAHFSWSSTLLIGEFYDSSNPSTNALGSILDPSPYAAADQVDISHGDSGGPSFYNGFLIGVHDLGICYTTGNVCSVPPAINSSNNSYFGDLYADVSVASNSSWILAQEVVSTPEPATGALMAAAAFLLFLFRKRS